MTHRPLHQHALFLPLALAVLVLFSASAAEPPRIGLVYATNKLAPLEENGKDPQLLYRQAIEEQGGATVVLGQSYSEAKLAEALGKTDAVLLPGGIDIDPKHYGEERHPKLGETDETLDQMQFSVLRHAKENGLPVLGICLGHQTINVFYGGALYQDIPSQLQSEVRVKHRGGVGLPLHAIAIQPGSILHGLLGAEDLTVNSSHHQAVKRLAPGFVATAHTEDGIVEAIERPGEPFLLGVQFHPEKMLDKEPRLKAIFKRFVEEARASQARRAQAIAASGAPPE